LWNNGLKKVPSFIFYGLIIAWGMRLYGANEILPLSKQTLESILIVGCLSYFGIKAWLWVLDKGE
jgi:hypothetical protein